MVRTTHTATILTDPEKLKDMNKKQQSKVKKVMTEFKEKALKSSSGKKVTNKKQAVAIALSEAKSKKYRMG